MVTRRPRATKVIFSIFIFIFSNCSNFIWSAANNRHSSEISSRLHNWRRVNRSFAACWVNSAPSLAYQMWRHSGPAELSPISRASARRQRRSFFPKSALRDAATWRPICKSPWRTIQGRFTVPSRATIKKMTFFIFLLWQRLQTQIRWPLTILLKQAAPPCTAARFQHDFHRYVSARRESRKVAMITFWRVCEHVKWEFWKVQMKERVNQYMLGVYIYIHV